MIPIDVSRLHFPVQALGPGKRIGVWLQGCSIRCPGCISLDTWEAGQGTTFVEEVLSALAVWAPDADGLTISGGEPLDQPQALASLLAGWRSLSSTPVLLFTGRVWAEARSWFEAHPDLVDAVIAGPYRARDTSNLALRGSDNQTLHVLSQRGEQFQSFERLKVAADRRLDVMFDEDGSAWFAGIPASGDFTRLSRLLREQGHSVTTSAQSRQVAQ
jgi:anaerobic ribonucleoside-triphosphate reductase activating protein